MFRGSPSFSGKSGGASTSKFPCSSSSQVIDLDAINLSPPSSIQYRAQNVFPQFKGNPATRTTDQASLGRNKAPKPSNRRARMPVVNIGKPRCRSSYDFLRHISRLYRSSRSLSRDETRLRLRFTRKEYTRWDLRSTLLGRVLQQHVDH